MEQSSVHDRFNPNPIFQNLPAAGSVLVLVQRTRSLLHQVKPTIEDQYDHVQGAMAFRGRVSSPPLDLMSFLVLAIDVSPNPLIPARA